MTDAERERLVLLIEECGEVIQAATKVLRHGYDSHDPGGTISNKEQLEKEIEEVAAIALFMRHKMDIISSISLSDIAYKTILLRKDPYFYHNGVDLDR